MLQRIDEIFAGDVRSGLRSNGQICCFYSGLEKFGWQYSTRQETRDAMRKSGPICAPRQKLNACSGRRNGKLG
jgi:hypothetical protein